MSPRQWIIGLLVLWELSVGTMDGVVGQPVNRESVESLLNGFESGDYKRLDELFVRKDEVLPALLAQTRNRASSTRVTALDLLARIDLRDDGVLNRDEILQTMLNAIDGSEDNIEAVDVALRFLNHMPPRTATPKMIQALILQLERGRTRALRVLGRLGDPALIPVLEPYVSMQRGVGDLAKQALAKLGNQQYLDEIVAELNMEGSVRSRAFEKLAYIGDKSTVREIARFLSHPDSPASGIGSWDRVGHLPYRHTAAWTLGQIIENPPVKKDLGLLSEQDIELWRTWWESHQHEYP